MDVYVQLMNPDPAVVATKLLARRTYKDTGKQFNLIAASWIQFMVHDWMDHLEDTEQVQAGVASLLNQIKAEKHRLFVSFLFFS